MLSPLIFAISSIFSRSSMRTRRQGWLLKCEGAMAATSTRRCWCSLLTGSGRKGPLVVLRLFRASRNSTYTSLLEQGYEPSSVEDHGEGSERSVTRRARPRPREDSKQRQHRQERPAVRRALQKPTPTASAAEAKTAKHRA